MKSLILPICIAVSMCFCTTVFSQQTQLIIPESYPAYAVSLSPNREWMVSMSGRNIQLWNYQMGKLIKNIAIANKNEQTWTGCTPITTNNRFAVFQISDSMYFLNFDKLEIVKQIKIDGVRQALAFSPDNSRLYMAGFTEGTYKDIILEEWGMAEQKIISQTTIPVKTPATHHPNKISFSTDGSRLLLADKVAGSWIINTATKSVEKSFLKTNEARPLTYLKNGNILAFTGAATKTMSAVLLNGKTFEPIKTSKKIYDDESGVSAVASYYFDVNIESEKLVLSYQMVSVVLNANSLVLEGKFKTPYENYISQEDNTLLLTNNGHSYLYAGSLKEYNVQNNTEPARTFGTPVFESFIQYVFKHNNGIAMKDRTISFDNGDIYMRYFKNINFEGALYRLSADGKKGYVYSDKYGLNTFDPIAAMPVFQHIDKVDNWKKSFVGMQVFDHLNLLALIGDDGVYVMDLQTFKLKYIIDIPFGLEYFLMEGTDKYCDITPDGSKMILFANVKDSSRSRISCVSLSEKEEIWNYETAEIRNLRFTDDGKNVMFTSLDSLITLNANDGKLANNIQKLPAGSDWGSIPTLSPSNNVIAAKKAYSVDKNMPAEVVLYSKAQQKQLGKMTGTGDNFYDFEFLKNERYLITVETGGLCLWDVEQQRRVGKLYLFDQSPDWVFVGADGRFDATSGALKTMYYVQGKEIIPLESLYEKYYTPGLLKQLWDKKGEAPVPDINKVKAPPKVEIELKQGEKTLTPEADDRTITTDKSEATIVAKGNGVEDVVTEIRMYLNGKLMHTTRNLTVEDDNNGGEKIMNRNFALALVPGKNNIKVVAINSQRTESLPAEMVVDYKPTDVKPINTGTCLYIITIGLNKYKNPKYNLNYALSDAKAFEESFKSGASGLFQKTESIHLYDEQATKAGIKEALNKIVANAKPQDLFVFFYAGHGVINDKKEFFLVPHDVTQLYGNDNALAQNGVSAAELQDFSKNIKSQKQLFILDACQSAGAFQNMGIARGAAEEKAIAQLARSTGTQWLSASGTEQFASEFEQLGHGTFTYCILEGFKGEADSGDKKLTIKELDAYLQDKVPEITTKYKGTPQYPASYSYGNDFPIIIIK